MSYYSRRPRRSRFTVTVEGYPAKRVILAYTAQGAVDHYNSCGLRVLDVVKGDLVNVHTPERKGGWKLSGRLAEAQDFLGLTIPVKIKQTGHQGGRYGAHSLRIDRATGKPYHHITVKSWLSVAEAGRTLWHELTHAMQAERCAAALAADGPYPVALADLSASAWLRAWDTTPERMGSYQTRAIEVEARSYEGFNDECPLAEGRR